MMLLGYLFDRYNGAPMWSLSIRPPVGPSEVSA